MKPVRRAALLVVAAALALGACSESRKSAPVAAAMQAGSGGAPDLNSPRMLAGASAPQAKRYIAVRNVLVIEVAPADVEAVLKDLQQQCKHPECELLESSLTRDSREALPTARARLRIAPSAAPAFLDALGKRGDVIERRVEAEDKTDEVVDVEARLKNMAELRDRLRKLLAAPNATVKDLVEVESQLARVQGDLDSAMGRRQALANQTEKVAVQVEIRPRRSLAEAGALEPIKDALLGAGHTFALSLAGLISFLVAVVPWLILVVPAVWAFRRWRRNRRPTTTSRSP